MSRGLTATLHRLATTRNEAAVDALLPALDAIEPAIRAGALRALLERDSAAGHLAIISRARQLEPTQPALFRELPCRMDDALREALLGKDRQCCDNACQVVLWSSKYDLFPTLVSLSESPRHPHADLGRRTVLQLAEQLSDELHGPGGNHQGRDVQTVRRQALETLEQGVRGYPEHGANEAIEAFLTLAQRDDSALAKMLQDSHHPSRKALLDVLERSRRPGVMRLLASFLEDPQPPLAVLRLIAARTDPEFVNALLERSGELPLGYVAKNLRRLESIAWAAPDHGVLPALGEEAQRRAVPLLLASGVSYSGKLRLLEYFVTQGKPAGRLTAVEALERFRDHEANDLAMRATRDGDARVQAAALKQVRPRGLPGGIQLLVDCIQSAHEEVRQAVREALAEFRFESYLTDFELLGDDVRRNTGRLVKLVDADALPRLRTELASPSRLRRIRAIEIADAMGAVHDLRAELSQRLEDEDHLVRAEASRVLTKSRCEQPSSSVPPARSVNEGTRR